MDGGCLFHLMDITIGSLDLIYRYCHHISIGRRNICQGKLRNGSRFSYGLYNDPICPSLNADIIVLCMHHITKGHLRMIIRPHSSLDHAVNSSPL